MNRIDILNNIENERYFLEKTLNNLIKTIGPIPIANNRLMPYGWRKSAKGRTVWRIVEEIISQNLELYAKKLGLDEALPADSEVGVYDFKFIYQNGKESYVNIKSSVKGVKQSKDDISKALSLLDFYKNNNANLYVATFVLEFNDNMTISFDKCIVSPVSWIPDIYINPSNNGNMQSSQYKDLDKLVRRTNEEFLSAFIDEYNVALMKKRNKLSQ